MSLPQHKPILNIIAGSQGSGKRGYLLELSKNKKELLNHVLIQDEIQLSMIKNRYVELDPFKISVSPEEFFQRVKNSCKNGKLKNYPDKKKLVGICIEENKIILDHNLIDQTFCSFISDLLKEKIIDTKQTLTLQQRLNSPGEINEIRKTKERGYKIHLHYIATEEYGINYRRHLLEMSMEGRTPLLREDIRRSYLASFRLLSQAVKYSDKFFFIDHSDDPYKVIAKKTSTRMIRVTQDNPPNWFRAHYFDSNCELPHPQG